MLCVDNKKDKTELKAMGLCVTDINFFLVKKAGRNFNFLKRAGRHQKGAGHHQKGAGRGAMHKRPRQNTV